MEDEAERHDPVHEACGAVVSFIGHRRGPRWSGPVQALPGACRRRAGSCNSRAARGCEVRPSRSGAALRAPPGGRSLPAGRRAGLPGGASRRPTSRRGHRRRPNGPASRGRRRGRGRAASTMPARGRSYSARVTTASAVGIEHLEGAHGERARGLVPQSGELLEVEAAVAVGVVGRVAVVAELVDFGLGELAVAVGVDGFEHFHRPRPRAAPCRGSPFRGHRRGGRRSLRPRARSRRGRRRRRWRSVFSSSVSSVGSCCRFAHRGSMGEGQYGRGLSQNRAGEAGEVSRAMAERRPDTG